MASKLEQKRNDKRYARLLSEDHGELAIKYLKLENAAREIIRTGAVSKTGKALLAAALSIDFD